MDRQQILDAIAKLDADPQVAKLRRELAETREQIANHELIRLQDRAVRLAKRLEVLGMDNHQRHTALCSKLQDAEPDEIRELRDHVDHLFQQHRVSDVPAALRGDPEAAKRAAAWAARGASLLAVRNYLHFDAWRAADWQTALREVLDQHREHVSELRHISIEAANV